MDESTGILTSIAARAVVLSTGGAGQIYARTTNPPSATGDGIAMAYRAGAVVEDMEFVQFHPTALYVPGTPPFLVSEAMRGEGGILRNVRGAAFMRRYHEMAELAPRDIVSRGIWNEMIATRARHVYLDVTHLGAAFIRKRFPTIYATCLRYDVDITEEMIPVCPSAHFMMGGVKTDVRGATSIPGLFGAGEVACAGVHGANRLASNSLLEGLVFGARAAEAAGGYATKRGSKREVQPEMSTSTLSERESPEPTDWDKVLNSLRRLMWNKVGIIRNRDGLLSAITRIKEWEDELMGFCRTRRDWEIQNMMTVGRLVAIAALRRAHSIGAHFRSDESAGRSAERNRHIQLSAATSEDRPAGINSN
jgi:L-aspartate oxidase